MKLPNRSDMKSGFSLIEVLAMKSGFSLIEVLVTLSIMSIGGLALMNLNVLGMKANKSNELRADLADIKRMITNSIGCDQTLGLRRPSTCLGPQVLKDRLNRDLAPDKKIGSWTIEATCESIGTPAKMGLSIYATQPLGRGLYAKDPLRNLDLDKKHPRSSLFDPAARLCSGSFSTPVAGECLYGVKVNPENQQVTCWERDDPKNIVRKSELAIISLRNQVTDLYNQNTNQQNQITDLYNQNTNQQNQITDLYNRLANPPWPANGYCIIQAPDNGCPAGFSPRNPGSWLGGTAGLDGAFIMGGDSSTGRSVSVRGPEPRYGRGVNYGVMGWAFCCK